MGGMAAAQVRGGVVLTLGGGDMDNVNFRDILRGLAIFDEEVADAGLRPSASAMSSLDAKTAALLRVAVSVAIGSSAVCLEWSTTRATAAGATKDEIAEVLLAIAPVVGLG